MSIEQLTEVVKTNLEKQIETNLGIELGTKQSQSRGMESKTDIYKNYVIKKYKRRYFRYNKQYERKGEIFYLKNFKSSFFVPLLYSDKNFIVMPFCGKPVGHSRRNQSLRNEIDHLALVTWLKSLQKELQRLKLMHRDINPTNILCSGNNKYTLIDFGWMTEINAKNADSTYPNLNSYAKSDEEAINKMCINAINILISKIASEKKHKGSSVKRGWVYHPIAFPEFNVNCHKSAAIQECSEVMDFIKNLNKQTKLNILDIGCSVGYFSFNMAQTGHYITGVEADPDVWKVAEAIRTLKEINNIDFLNEKINTDVLEKIIKKTTDNQIDLTLMLNVHMWIYLYMGAEKTFEFMKKLSQSTKHLLFQTAGRESKGKYTIKELANKGDIKKYLELCGFKNVMHIRDTRAHGGIRSLFSARGC
jgi:SAM-dependent methyltransferase/tRNA A-37 threonylcarbamoyl transferase component Bud32